MKTLALLLILPFSAVLGAYFGGAYSFLAPIIMLLLIPVLDLWIGEGDIKDHIQPPIDKKWFKYLVTVSSLLFYTAMAMLFKEADYLTAVGTVLSSGIITGFIIHNLALEVAIDEEEDAKFLGCIMLAPICYGHHIFQTLHNHSHYVATKKDPHTAAYKESLPSFIKRSVPSAIKQIWKYEAYRLRKIGLSKYHYKNRFLISIFAGYFIAILTYSLLNVAGLCFFILNSICSIAIIEATNYVSHYGTNRRNRRHGGYEPIEAKHAWDSDFALSNYILVAFSYHSGRHLNWKRPRRNLERQEESPKLPYGYITMVWIAFIPILWSYIMEPLAQRLHRNLPLDLKQERRKKVRENKNERESEEDKKSSLQ